MTKSNYDLSGISKNTLKRVPNYVHSPETIRQLFIVLGRFEPKEREAIFKHVNRMLYSGQDIINSVIEYSNDEYKTWLVVKNTLNDVMRMVNLSGAHPNDIDRFISAFLILRNYGFKLPFDKIERFINATSICMSLRKCVLSIVGKINKGITPKKTTKGPFFKENIVRGWLEI